MGEWNNYKLKDFLRQYRITHKVKDDAVYGQITISKTNAVSFRERKVGKEIGRKRQFFIDLKKHPHTLIFTRQGVADGSIGLAPLEVDEFIATENMPMFSVNVSKILPDLLGFLLQSDGFKSKVKKLTPIGSAQKAIHERDLLELEFFLPKEIDFQRKLVSKLNKVKDCISNIDILIEKVSQDLSYLRQAVLQEAIEGKLTAEWRRQNPALINGENHASQFLEQIRTGKERLIQEGKIKKDLSRAHSRGKPLPPIADDEKPFGLPDGWAWCRLGEICGFITKGTTPPTHELKNNGDIPYLKVYNIVDQKIDFFYRAQFISAKIHEKLSRSTVYPGDVLMNIVGPPLGKVAIVPCDFNEWNINQALAVFRPVIKGINRFLYAYLLAGLEIKKIHTLGIVGQDNISLTQCRNIIFPLPPLAEQQSIVERVDKLMAMIDELEKQVSERKDQAEMLMQSVLREAFAGNK